MKIIFAQNFYKFQQDPKYVVLIKYLVLQNQNFSLSPVFCSCRSGV